MNDEAQEELLQNMRLLNEFGYYGGDSLDESHSVSSSMGIYLNFRTDILQLDLGGQIDNMEGVYRKGSSFCQIEVKF